MATTDDGWVDVPEDEWVDVPETSTPAPEVTPVLEAAPAKKMGTGEALARGVAEGGTFGFAGELGGAVSALRSLLGGPSPGVKFGAAVQPSPDDTPEVAALKQEALAGQKSAYQLTRDAIEARQRQAATDRPGAYYSGMVGSGLATALLPVGAAAQGAKALSLGGRVARGATTGAGLGALSAAGGSQADLTRGEATQLLLDMAGGGLGGAGLGAATPLVGAAASAVGTRYVKPAAQRLASYAGDKAREFALNAAGLIGKDFKKLEPDEAARLGQWLLENKIVTPFASKATVAERLGAARAKAGQEIGRLLEKAGAEVDSPALVKALKESSQELGPFRQHLQAPERGRRIGDIKKFFGFEEVPTAEARQAASELEQQMAQIVTQVHGGATPTPRTVQTAFGPRREVMAQDLAEIAGRTQEVPTIPRNVRELNALKTELDDLIKWHPATTQVEQSVNEARKALAGVIRGTVKQTARGSLEPDDYARLEKAFADYGPAAELSGIAKEGIAREAGNNPWSLSAILASLGGLGLAGGAGTMAGGPVGGLLGAGLAGMGGKILKERGSSMGTAFTQGLSRNLPAATEGAGRGLSYLGRSLASGAGSAGTGALVSRPGGAAASANVLRALLEQAEAERGR